jgi:5-methylcytosine-specific restriction endonuclease McrA
MFDMMVKGCFYCGGVATTIDRVDSKLEHTPENCVGCCKGCNNSKGTADSATFIRKAYYNARGKYVDDIKDIWFVNKQKPCLSSYRRNAEKKGVPFVLTKKDFDILTKDICAYCQRSPTTWFGIDRKIPYIGYILDNIVTCCFDCNVDKHINDANATSNRNERIANRVDTGDLDIKKCEKVFLHQGINKSSQKVCVYGKMYVNKREASRAIGRSDNYVGNCIRDDRHSDVIFRVNDEFYKEYKDSDLYITKEMYN